MRVNFAIALALLAGVSSPALGQGTEFLRVGETTDLDGGDVRSSYSLERSGAFEQTGKGGSQGEYKGIKHRLALDAGLGLGFSAGLEQSIKQSAPGKFKYGVLIPEVRFRWNELGGALGRLPVDLSTFVASHVRVSARRGSSVVAGLGASRDKGSWRFSSDLGAESTVNGDVAERGLRYEIGLGYRLSEPLTLSAEAWGTFVWPQAAASYQSHHGGPSLRYSFGRPWVGASLGAGIEGAGQQGVVDYTGMAQVGVRL